MTDATNFALAEEAQMASDELIDEQAAQAFRRQDRAAGISVADAARTRITAQRKRRGAVIVPIKPTPKAKSVLPAAERRAKTSDKKHKRLMRELPHIDQTTASHNATQPCPKITVKQQDCGSILIGVDHPDRAIGWALMANALGTSSDDFTRILLHQLVNVFAAGGAVDAATLNGALAT